MPKSAQEFKQEITVKPVLLLLSKTIKIYFMEKLWNVFLETNWKEIDLSWFKIIFII